MYHIFSHTDCYILYLSVFKHSQITDCKLAISLATMRITNKRNCRWRSCLLVRSWKELWLKQLKLLSTRTSPEKPFDEKGFETSPAPAGRLVDRPAAGKHWQSRWTRHPGQYLLHLSSQRTVPLLPRFLALECTWVTWKAFLTILTFSKTIPTKASREVPQDSDSGDVSPERCIVWSCGYGKTLCPRTMTYCAMCNSPALSSPTQILARIKMAAIWHWVA